MPSPPIEIKTFRAKTMRDALAEVRRQFGPDATVLHTRELNSGPIARLLRGRGVEVAATPASDPQPPALSPSPAPVEPMTFPLLASAEDDPGPPGIDLSGRVASRLDELHAMVRSLGESRPVEPRVATDQRLPEPLFRLFTRLVDADVDEATARVLISEARGDLPASMLEEPSIVEERLFAAVRRRLPTRGPIEAPAGESRIAALVGPTGVGKTTTVAKLAANFRIRDRRSVGLITVDTYRVAAVEQLRTYAEIIDLPMEVVSTPREMRAAVERLRDQEIVLIDTAGRSPRDELRLEELRVMLAEAEPDETHLVLSATTTRRGLADAVRRFTPVGIDALLVTKLDEAATLGSLLDAADDGDGARLPLSYLTDGQDVPDDILVAEADRLARRVLEPGPA